MKDLMNRLRSFSHRAAETTIIGAVIAFSQKHKLVARVTCLVLAVLFWVYVDNKRISEVRFRIPVQIDLLRDFAVADIEKRYVVVAARGSGDDLRNVNQNNISVFVKIQNPTIGETAKYPVTVLANEISDAITLVPEDKTLFAMIEKRKVRSVHVEPRVEGSLGSQFVLGNEKVTPDEVEISGAESVVNRIHSLETEPISISGHVETFSQGVKLNIVDTKLFDIDRKYFTVDLSIYNAKDVTLVIVNLSI